MPQIADAAHAVILASGTLSPIQSLCRQLFPGHPVFPVAPPDSFQTSALHLPVTQTPSQPEIKALHHFSCGHVVAASRLLCVPIGVGPTGLSLELSHRQRSRLDLLDEVGRLLLNVCQAVPEVE